MMSFREFMEIAVGSDITFPSPAEPVRRSWPIVPSEDDVSHKIIPFVVHPKMIEPMEEILRMAENRPAARVFKRILDQPRDGGMLAVNTSNLEAEDLDRMGAELINDSNRVMSSNMGGSMKDDAMKWISFGNNLKKSVEDGIKAATMQKNEN
jgi:hypothetical protein